MVFIVDSYSEDYYLSNLSEEMNNCGIYNTILVSNDLKLYWLFHDSLDDYKDLSNKNETVINDVFLKPAVRVRQDLYYIKNYGKDFIIDLDVKIINKNIFSTEKLKDLFNKISNSKLEDETKYFLTVLFINDYFSNKQKMYAGISIDNAKKIFEQNKIILLEVIIENIESIFLSKNKLLDYKTVLEKYVELCKKEYVNFDLYNSLFSDYLSKKTSDIIVNIIEQKEWWNRLSIEIEETVTDYENNVLYKFINTNKLVSKNIEIDDDIEEIKTDIKKIKIKKDVANKYYLIGFGYANSSRELLKKAFKEILNYDVIDIITSPGMPSFKLEGLVLESEKKIEMNHVSILLKNIFKNWHLSQHSSNEAWNEIERQSNKEILEILIEPSLNKSKKVKF